MTKAKNQTAIDALNRIPIVSWLKANKMLCKPGETAPFKE